MSNIIFPCVSLSVCPLSVHLSVMLPASMPQLDACPTGDQEVADSTPTRSTTFFHKDWIMKYFLCHSLLIQEEQLSVWGERMCTILVNRLED